MDIKKYLHSFFFFSLLKKKVDLKVYENRMHQDSWDLSWVYTCVCGGGGEVRCLLKEGERDIYYLLLLELRLRVGGLLQICHAPF